MGAIDRIPLKAISERGAKELECGDGEQGGTLLDLEQPAAFYDSFGQEERSNKS